MSLRPIPHVTSTLVIHLAKENRRYRRCCFWELWGHLSVCSPALYIGHWQILNLCLFMFPILKMLHCCLVDDSELHSNHISSINKNNVHRSIKNTLGLGLPAGKKWCASGNEMKRTDMDNKARCRGKTRDQQQINNTNIHHNKMPSLYQINLSFTVSFSKNH